MKKLFIAGFVLCSAIILIGAQTGFAWPTYEGGCQNCHGTGLSGFDHAKHAAAPCTACHPGAAGAKPIPTSNCIVCHPTSDPGKCNLVNAHGQSSSCITCHQSECAASTTTTTAEGTTTTTAEGTTTTTVPSEDCITIAPNSVTVSGTDVEEDVVVTFTRTDIIDATQEQLDKLVIEVDDSCAQYITINSSTVNIGTDKVTEDLNITVQGDAPASTCSIKVSDPQGAFTPPLNCTATFTIFSQSQCSVTVEPTILPLKAGVLPKVRRIRIIGENSNFKLFQSKVTIEDIPIVIPLLVTQGIRINAWIVIPSTLTDFEPGSKQVKVETGTETCFGTVDIEGEAE